MFQIKISFKNEFDAEKTEETEVFREREGESGRGVKGFEGVNL